MSMNYLKKFVKEYCGNTAFQQDFNTDDCKTLEVWQKKLSNIDLISDEEYKKFFKDYHPIASTYLCHKVQLPNDIIDFIIQECESYMDITAVMMQELNERQLTNLKNKIGIDVMNQRVCDKHYAPLLSQKCIDYVAKEMFKTTNSLISETHNARKTYQSLSLTKNRSLINEFLSDGELINEQKLSMIVNNEFISSDIRIKAFNMGCDYTMLDCHKALPDEILINIYHSFADAHTEHHTLYTTVDADLTFQMLAQNPYLPHGCQMDYLMRWMNSRAQDHILIDILENTTQSTILEQATKLKSKCSNIAYDNICVPKKCLEERLHKLYKQAKSEKEKTNDISNLCVERIVKCINRLCLNKFDTDNLLSLDNDFINMNLLRRNISDNTKINLADLQKFHKSSNCWCRFYSILSYNIHTGKNGMNYTASNKEQIYEIVRNLQYQGNKDYRNSWRADPVKSGVEIKEREAIIFLRQQEVLLGQKKSLYNLIINTIKQAEIDSDFKIQEPLERFEDVIERQLKLQNFWKNYTDKSDSAVLCSELREIAGKYNNTIGAPEFVYNLSDTITAMEFYESLIGFTDKIEENYKLIKEIENEQRKTEMEI